MCLMHSGLTIASEKKRIRQRMTDMYCTKCGAKLPRDARFCTNCGKPVVAIAPAKVVESTGAPAKAVNPVAASREAAAPAAAPAKTVVRLRRKRRTREGMAPRQAAIPRTLLHKMVPQALTPCKAIPHSAIPRSKTPLLRMSLKSHAGPAHSARLRRLKTTPR